MRGGEDVRPVAVAHVMPRGKGCDGSTCDTGVRGTVTFTQVDEDECLIEWNITGLSPGEHGFHIHEKADFSDGCKSAGPHYNPFNTTHGGPNDKVRHVGDLGNIVANSRGVAVGEMRDKLIKLHGPTSILQRSVMVHGGVDDLGKGGDEESLITGNAGSRVACGAIVMAPLK